MKSQEINIYVSTEIMTIIIKNVVCVVVASVPGNESVKYRYGVERYLCNYV